MLATSCIVVRLTENNFNHYFTSSSRALTAVVADQAQFMHNLTGYMSALVLEIWPGPNL